MTPGELLQVYDTEVRGSFAHRLPPGWTAEQDGPLTRCLTHRSGFAMLTGAAAELSTGELAGLVERTTAFYAAQGRWFEFKTFDHDRDDLRPLLLSAGAVPEEHETLILGEAALLATTATLPEGITIRTTTDPADFVRVAAMESEVWGEDWSWLADDLTSRAGSDEPVHVFLAEDGDLLVSAAWLVPLVGTRVAGLWGGSTLASHRGHGIYRALVAARATLAVHLGYHHLQVDASDDSRPILERLGLTAVGGTQPYILGR